MVMVVVVVVVVVSETVRGMALLIAALANHD